MWYLTKDSILIHQTYRIALTWHHFVEFMKKYTVEIHSLCCALLWKFTQNWCWPRVFTRLQRVLVEFAKQFPLDSVDICFTGFSGHLFFRLTELLLKCNIIYFLPKAISGHWDIVVACICLSVCLSVSVLLSPGCLRHNLSHVCARIPSHNSPVLEPTISKFGPIMHLNPNLIYVGLSNRVNASHLS